MDAMVTNRTITHLGIFEYGSQDDIAQAASSMLDHNKTLIYMGSIQRCPNITPRLRTQIQLKLFINRHLGRVRSAECNHWFVVYGGFYEPGIYDVMDRYMCPRYRLNGTPCGWE